MEHEEHGLVPLVEELQLTEDGTSYSVGGWVHAYYGLV